MSLYDEPQGILKSLSPSWTPGIRFLESHLKTKKNSTGERSKKVNLAPVIDLSCRNITITSKHVTPREENQPKNNDEWDIEDEYDPSHPNDYFKIQQKINEEKPNVDSLEMSGNFLSSYGYNSGESDEEIDKTKKKSKNWVEVAPPPSLLSSDVIIKKPSNEKVVENIMAKYGFKKGHGLGKDGQGMASALQVQPISHKCGRIIHEKDLLPPEVASNASDMLKNPSKIVLLTNIVRHGEVDDQLENEIRDECREKYGHVVDVRINERANVPEDEAVEVFVRFERLEAAVKALVDLHGRYFGGRKLKAAFYRE